MGTPGHLIDFIKAKLAKTKPANPAILLSTGAFSPVHKAHVEILHKAWRRLKQTKNYDILAGILSPSCDLYVANYKHNSTSKKSFIRGSLRLEMTKLAVRDHNKTSPGYPLFAGGWEVSREVIRKYRNTGGFPNFTTVVARYAEILGVTVIYVCGADHYRYIKSEGGLQKMVGNRKAVCAVIPRTGEQDYTNVKLPGGDFVVNIQASSPLSSTAVRKVLIKHSGGSFKAVRPRLVNMLPRSVVKYMEAHWSDADGYMKYLRGG